MLDQLTDGQLEWEPLGNPYDHVVLGPPDHRRVYPIYSGKERFPAELKRCFPGEEKAIDEYIRLVKVLWLFCLLLPFSPSLLSSLPSFSAVIFDIYLIYYYIYFFSLIIIIILLLIYYYIFLEFLYIAALL